jgi:hypothetical protein
MLFGQTVAVYCGNRTEQTLCGQNAVRTSQESNRLLLFGGTVAVYCDNRTEHTNTLCGQSEPHSKDNTCKI